MNAVCCWDICIITCSICASVSVVAGACPDDCAAAKPAEEAGLGPPNSKLVPGADWPGGAGSGGVWSVPWGWA
ncbi:hypothetical protein PF008_g33437 [Phytophthora fragariae]|uniref:Secreted protein n=1 Tax=Phytophthora fragariae TaxID=53985 RepID=A0A6G0PX10_9STRA|nr:hypothetical protein PF008_g33437 [Phytophthora fragariae]